MVDSLLQNQTSSVRQIAGEATRRKLVAGVLTLRKKGYN